MRMRRDGGGWRGTAGQGEDGEWDPRSEGSRRVTYLGRRGVTDVAGFVGVTDDCSDQEFANGSVRMPLLSSTVAQSSFGAARVGRSLLTELSCRVANENERGNAQNGQRTGTGSTSRATATLAFIRVPMDGPTGGHLALCCMHV